MTWGLQQSKPTEKNAVPCPPEDCTTVGARIYPSYPTKYINVLGATQLVCGVVCVILGIARIYVTEHHHRFRYDVGICEGAFFLFTGIIGIISAVSKTRGMIICAALGSALSSALALTLGVGWLGFVLLKRGCHGRRRRPFGNDGIKADEDEHLRKRPYDLSQDHSETWHRNLGHRDETTDEPAVMRSFHGKFLMMRIIDWVLLAIFVNVAICSIVIVVKACQALRARRREGTGDAQESQVFVITPEKGAVIS